jgi:FixJ family two-component response regulator
VSPRACTVCTHPELEAINHALVEGIPNRRIASHHDVTERAVRNHKAGHLPAALAKAQEAREVAKARRSRASLRSFLSYQHHSCPLWLPGRLLAPLSEVLAR